MAAQGFGEVAEQLRRSTVVVQSGSRGGGSGIIWSDGLIVTNAHVAREKRAVVQLWDGRSLQAEVANRDPRRDLASLKIEAGALPAVASGDSGTLRPGELVIAIGNPLGFVGALTQGVVHGVGPLRGLGRQSWVQADIRLAPGNSGGPLADARGRVVGINTMVAGGLALAIPSNTVQRFVRDGETSPSLGVVVRPVPVGHVNGRALGLLVLEVADDGAAAAASLLPGDLLIAANGRPFAALDDLSDALDSSRDGVLSLRFLRGDRRNPREVAVRLALRSAA